VDITQAFKADTTKD